jgi:hypothetical protein
MSAKWQATALPNPSARNSGSTWPQSGCAMGQRVTNRQPLGGLIGIGGSPLSGRLRRPRSSFGSGTGTATISVWV